MNSIIEKIKSVFVKPEPQKQNYWNDQKVNDTHVISIPSNQILQKVAVIENKPTPKFFNPKPGFKITSKFGWRVLRQNGKDVKNYHSGIDLGGFGDVFSVEDCIVKSVLLPDPNYPCQFQWTKDKGWITAPCPKDRAWTPYLILIGIHSKNQYKYYHVKSDLKPNDHVSAGFKIAVTGNYGYCMGAHLHFEVWYPDKNNQYKTPTDPELFFKDKGIK